MFTVIKIIAFIGIFQIGQGCNCKNFINKFLINFILNFSIFTQMANIIFHNLEILMFDVFHLRVQ